MNIEDQLPETLKICGWASRGEIVHVRGHVFSMSCERFKSHWHVWRGDDRQGAWVWEGSDGSWWVVRFDEPNTLHRYPDLNTAAAATLLKLG